MSETTILAERRARAMVLHGAGDLRMEDVAVAAPGPGEVLLDVAYCGICGSDLHYAIHGRGAFSIVTEPLILGHELSARIAALGPGVDDGALSIGQPVAVNPARPCGSCRDCLEGRPQTCQRTRYLGAANFVPHVQGGIVEQLVVSAAQAVPLPDGVGLRLAALAEPLAVSVHGVRRAGNVAGRHVLVTGAGPIGLLAAVAARAAGAASVVVTDLQDLALGLARRLGVTEALNVGRPDGQARLAELGGHIDVAIEASGVHAALRSCVDAVRSGGVVVQLGMMAEDATPVPVGRMMAREIDYRASLRFGHEFAEAVRLLGEHPELEALITHEIPLADAPSSIATAADRTSASKVLIALDAH